MFGSVLIACSRLWSDDTKKQNGVKCINCDCCVRKMHTKCIPLKHLNAMGYTMDDSLDSKYFVCEQCR